LAKPIRDVLQSTLDETNLKIQQNSLFRGHRKNLQWECPPDQKDFPFGRAQTAFCSKNNMKRLISTISLALLMGLLARVSLLIACPFCSAVSQTLRQEMGVMDAVAIAEATVESVRNEETGRVKLRVVSVLKGETLVKPDETITAVYYGAVEPGRRFMLSGADPNDIQWSCLPITEVSEKYLLDLTKLADDPLVRLKFYQDYLQHPDGMLNRDAYDEFAIAPYAVVQQLKPHMNHNQLIKWLAEPELPADRKRLYLTMLGICGDEKDLPMLDEMLRSTQSSSRGGLDALIACYLVLAGEKGLPTIDEMFLKNPKAPYAETYAAIMAIRFHGTETDKIPRSVLVRSLHHVLERKDLADLVIPDLARWGDWSQIAKLEELFVAAEKDNNWIRVPVVNYLRACPNPEAVEAIKRLKEIDPESVKRASSFFSIPIPAAPAAPATSLLAPREKETLVSAGSQSQNSLGLRVVGGRFDKQLASLPFVMRTEHAFAIAHGASSSSIVNANGVNRVSMVAVPLLTFASFIIILYLVLGGGGKRIATFKI